MKSKVEFLKDGYANYDIIVDGARIGRLHFERWRGLGGVPQTSSGIELNGEEYQRWFCGYFEDAKRTAKAYLFDRGLIKA